MLTLGDSPKRFRDRCSLTIPMADGQLRLAQPFISSSLCLLATLSSTGVLDPEGGVGHRRIGGSVVPCSQWAGLEQD